MSLLVMNGFRLSLFHKMTRVTYEKLDNTKNNQTNELLINRCLFFTLKHLHE